MMTMKKVLSILLAGLSVCCLLTACDSYSLPKFRQSIQRGDYAKAARMYRETALGNLEREREMIQVLADLADQAVSDYLSDAVEYESAQTRLDTIQYVVDNSGIGFDSVSDYEERLARANDSKIAYDAGNRLLEDENYAAAIEEYQKVIEGDCRYATARERLKDIVAVYKREIIEKAEQSAGEGRYDEALRTIDEGLKLLSEDGELSTLRVAFVQNDVARALKEADEAFVTPQTDYEKSIAILKSAMQKYPDHASLQEQYNYYMEFQPISLFDMTSYTRDNSCSEEVTDNAG